MSGEEKANPRWDFDSHRKIVMRGLAKASIWEVKRQRVRALFPGKHWTPKYILPGICLSDICRATGIHLNTMTKLFNGKMRPTLAMLISMAEFLTAATDTPVNINDVLKLVEHWAQKTNKK